MHTLTEKIDTIELILHCIKDHENKASDLIQTIENLQYIQTHNNKQ